MTHNKVTYSQLLHVKRLAEEIFYTEISRHSSNLDLVFHHATTKDEKKIILLIDLKLKGLSPCEICIYFLMIEVHLLVTFILLK